MSGEPCEADVAGHAAALDADLDRVVAVVERAGRGPWLQAPGRVAVVERETRLLEPMLIVVRDSATGELRRHAAEVGDEPDVAVGMPAQGFGAARQHGLVRCDGGHRQLRGVCTCDGRSTTD